MKSLAIIFASLLVFSGCAHLDQLDKDNITAPKLKKEPKLIYPVSAQSENRSGISVLYLGISSKGHVEKTHVYKSSGHADLDEAALAYCRGLVFEPARQNGNPIPAQMKWQVKFDLANMEKDIFKKIAKVKDLYSVLQDNDNTKKFEIQTDILNIHTSVINEVQDGRKFNEYMYEVIRPDIREEWEKNTDNYPLTFLLYHDFIRRFESYDSLNTVKEMLKYSLERDMEYLQTAENLSNNFTVKKDELISYIRNFIKENYPELKIDVTAIAEKINNNNIS